MFVGSESLAETAKPCPVTVKQYNRYVGVLETADQYCDYYKFTQKTVKECENIV